MNKGDFPLHPTQLQITNARLSAIEQHAALSAQPAFTAADFKPVQVHIFPAEGDLQFVLKLCNAGVVRHEQGSAR